MHFLIVHRNGLRIAVNMNQVCMVLPGGPAHKCILVFGGRQDIEIDEPTEYVHEYIERFIQ